MSNGVIIGLIITLLAYGLFRTLVAVRTAREDWLKGHFDD